jgi:pyruvate dehydrogenase E1 component alpha subunit
MAEMFGKQGLQPRAGRIDAVFDAAARFYGGNAIVAGGLPVAVGLALADRYLDRQRVTMCVFGDGAVAEGEFHESMNLPQEVSVLFSARTTLRDGNTTEP